MTYLKRIWFVIREILNILSITVAVILFCSLCMVLFVIWLFTMPIALLLAIPEMLFLAFPYYVVTGRHYYGNYNSIAVVWAHIPTTIDDGAVGFRKNRYTRCTD